MEQGVITSERVDREHRDLRRICSRLYETGQRVLHVFVACVRMEEGWQFFHERGG